MARKSQPQANNKIQIIQLKSWSAFSVDLSQKETGR